MAHHSLPRLSRDALKRVKELEHVLAETPNVEIRTKYTPAAPMHLKSYQIDGRMLRSGAANFSASGLKRQDNDLIVIERATRQHR